MIRIPRYLESVAALVMALDSRVCPRDLVEDWSLLASEHEEGAEEAEEWALALGLPLTRGGAA